MVRLWLLVLAGGWAMPGLIGAPDWLLDPSSYTARVTPNADGRELVMENGLLRRVIRIHPNAATVALDHLGSGESLLRGVKPEAVVELEGRQFEVGGLKGQPNYAFLRPEWIPELQADTNAFQFTGYAVGRPEERLSWRRVRHHAPGVKWPPEGVSLRLDFAAPESAAGTPAAGVRISVHFELYDGVPAYSKWLTLTQTGAEPVRLDRFSSEVLAFVERTSEVDELSEGRFPQCARGDGHVLRRHDGLRCQPPVVPLAARSGLPYAGELREADPVPAGGRTRPGSGADDSARGSVGIVQDLGAAHGCDGP